MGKGEAGARGGYTTRAGQGDHEEDGGREARLCHGGGRGGHRRSCGSRRCGTGKGYFGRDKLDAWMERGKKKMKNVVEEQSEAAKDWFSNFLDDAHDFVKSIVEEMSTGNSVVLNLHESSPFLHAYFFVSFGHYVYCFCTLSISSQKVCYTGAVDDKGGVKEGKESETNGGGLSKPRRSSLSREGATKDEL